jgi:hypothetical protein
MPYEFDDWESEDGGSYSPPPSYESADWALIANLVGDATGYVTASIASTSSLTASLNGTYSVTDVTADVITLGSPEDDNPAWATLVGESAYGSPTLSTQGEAWVGPFVVDMDNADTLVLNITASQGMYYTTEKGKDRSWYVDTQFEATPVDEDGEPVGAPITQTKRVQGDGKDKSPRGVTLEFVLPDAGRYRVRGRRITPKTSAAVRAAQGVSADDKGTAVDEVQWRDAFGTELFTEDHFGDVTTVFTRTYATPFAVAQKERKLTCRATRKVYQRNLDDTFGPALVSSRNAADIICHMVLDPYIGGRPDTELDVEQIYATIDEVQDYFGFADAGEFGYTFDGENVSGEEMIQTVAQAVFCTAYRQGALLRLFFERRTEDSILLFNHRNKVPGSETRTIRFGKLNDYDGVELDYVSARDGATLTVYIPADRSATKPRKMKILGVVDHRGDGAVPFLHASRAWNKIKFQHTATEFTAYAEASQLVVNQRVEVTDNTRPDVIDGEVRGQDGLVLELSQPFEPEDGIDYVIHLQLSTGSVEVITCTAGPDRWHCTLSAPPSEPLVVRDTAWALTTYQIVGSDAVRPSAFLISEKGAFSRHQVPVQAINYDDRYYEDDLTYNV